MLISLNVLAQKYELNYRGTFSSSIINGYVGDAAFWNDTCYFISGDGSRLFTTTLDGSLVGNYFSGKTFNTASQLYVNQDYVIVLEQGKIVFYTKQGQFVRQISVPNTRYHYFWIKNNQEIMLVAGKQIIVYNYLSGSILSQKKIANAYWGHHFLTDGKKMYVPDGKISYEYKNGLILQEDLTTLYDNSQSYYYLSCLTTNEAFWFEYLERDKLYITDRAFTHVTGTFPLLPASQKPTQDELYIESGNPILKIISAQDQIYVINTPLNQIEFYKITKN